MRSLPASVAEAVRPHAGAVRAAEPVGGGCIAHATRVETERGAFFLKWAAGDAGRTFAAEAEGLRALRVVAPAGIAVPEPLAWAVAEGPAPGFLLATWVGCGHAGPGYWAGFGEALAALHRAAAPAAGDAGPYGFPVETFCGPTPQPNGWAADWPAFFRDRRLTPMAARLRASGRWRPAWDRPFDRLLARLDGLLPARPHPSLLHGDLWSGNAFPTTDGGAALVDPAAYVGHREADLAMTELFGGFEPAFYDAYRAAWPLEPGYEERREVYDLYHLLNHLLLFGGGYAGGVERTLGRFGR